MTCCVDAGSGLSLSVPKQLPSYKNFKGLIHELGQNQYLVSGEVSVIDRNTIEITELPVRTWTQVKFSLFFLGYHIVFFSPKTEVNWSPCEDLKYLMIVIGYNKKQQK